MAPGTGARLSWAAVSPSASPHRLRLPGAAVFVPVAVASAAGLVVELAYYGEQGVPPRLVSLLSLSYEANIPTWLASCLLFSCAVLLLAVAREGPRAHPRHWWVLGVLFLYMSLDEAVELHEHLGGLVEAGGVLYFSWVIPAALFVAVVGLAYVPFLRDLPAPTRWRFLVAGAVYVSGALLMELPLGHWTERHGNDNLGYALIDWVEETLELAGAGLFLVALCRHYDNER